MGLDNWVDSDEAADFMAGLLKACEKELKNKSNEFNTPRTY